MNNFIKPHKILAIQFKYLGDAVFITPALLALKAQYPESELHVLVAKEAAPLFEHLTWITKVWAFPRSRGKAKISESLPFIKALRAECYDRSVDFGGNDRGAILSRLIGAKVRLAALDANPKFIKRIAYTDTIAINRLPDAWVARHLQLLTMAWQTPAPELVRITIEANPALTERAKAILKEQTIICHLGTSQLKKEWPIIRWYEFYQLANAAGYRLAFSVGTNDREQALLAELKLLAPDCFALPRLANLSEFLAVLKQAQLVISGDTGPLHFASGLGVKVIGLFGTADSEKYAAPIYDAEELIHSETCFCINELAHFSTCHHSAPCMASISAESVFNKMRRQLLN